MVFSRSFGAPWLILLVLVCSLLGRPLHEAWHIAHPLGESGGIAVATAVVTDSGVTIGSAAESSILGEDRTNASDDGTANNGSASDGSASDDIANDGTAGASDITDNDDTGEAGEAGTKADACAWCLFHGQAAAPGRAPAALLTHAESSPPPAALPCERVCSRDWTVAKPRGPPSA